MTKKKSAPKTEAKKVVKPIATPKPKVEAVKSKEEIIDYGNPTYEITRASEPEEKPVKEAAVKTRFQVGDVIKHEGRLYQCISMNGHHDAVLASYSHLNNRADHSKTRTVSNDPKANDGFTFTKY